MKTISNHLNNDRGSVIIAALMMLALLTIIGFAATNMSTTELSISTNALLYERAFFTAEAGLQRAKESLRTQFDDFNNAQIASGLQPVWDFALNGAGGFPVPAMDSELGYEAVEFISADTLNGVSYRVRFWDNDDGDGSRLADVDGKIYVRADATGLATRGGRCSIEELVEGSSTGGNISGYTAQEGAGSGKVYTSNDTRSITNFNRQL